MALASLTIDLIANLSRFEGDIGRAAQIVTRDSEKMSRAALAVERALIKQADQVGRTAGEYLALKAAEAGLGDGVQRYIDIATKSGAVTAAASRTSVAAIQGVRAAAETSAERQTAINAELVRSVRQVSDAYDVQRRALIAAKEAGTISDETLKGGLAKLSAGRDTDFQKLKFQAAQDLAAKEVAATEAATLQKRAEAFEQLRVKIQQASHATAQAQIADAQRIKDSLAGIGPSYRKSLEALQASFAAGRLSAAEFQQALARLNDTRPDVQKYKAEQAAQVAAERQLATVAERSAEERRQAAQRLIDRQNGLTAAYREQLLALRALRDAGDITPAQFRKAGIELVEKNPRVAEAAALRQAEDAAAKAAAARALALAQTGASTALAAAQSQVYAAFLIAEAAASNQTAAAQARQAEIAQQVASASDRARASQEAALQAKTAYIAKINEEAAALFRSRDAQRQLDGERAGLSPKQAVQTAKFSGDREFISTIYQAIEAEERFAATFGKTAAEILKQDAATRQLSNTTAGAISRFEALAAANQKTRNAAADAKSNDAYLQSLEREISLIGKTRAEIVALELAKRGLTTQGAPLVKRIAEIDQNLNKFGKTSGVARYQLQTLQYTISDTIASLASGISPMTILLQQGGQVIDVFGSVGAVFSRVASLFTVARIAIGGAAAAVGTLAYAMYQGAEQSKQFNDAVVLSGNFAGQTAGQFTALTRRIAESGQVTVSSAREFGQALLATGQIGPAVFDAATEAAARYGQATGKNAKDVAGHFASMADGAFKWASETNKQLNFLSSAELQHIRRLEESGRTVEAQAVIYEALNRRLRDLEPNLGTLDRLLLGVSKTWAGFWDRAFDVGRAETIEEKVAKTNAAIARLRPIAAAEANITPITGGGSFGPAQKPASEQLARELDNANGLLREQGTAYALAQKKAADAQITKEAEIARAGVEGWLLRAKAASQYDREVAKQQAGFQKLALAGTPVSEKEQKTILAEIKEAFTNKAKSNSSANQLRKSELDQDLKGIRDAFEVEKQALQFSQQELQALYQAGAVSVVDYYDKKRQNTSEGVAKELVALRVGEDRIRRELSDLAKNRTLKPEERKNEEVVVNTKLNDNIALQAKVRAEAAQAGKIANIDEGESFRQLADRVNEFRATIAQLSGDETQAARIRTQAAFDQARLLQAQAPSQVSDSDVDRVLQLTAANNKFAAVQRDLAIASAKFSSAEEEFLLLAEQRGLSLQQQDEGLLRIRERQLVQLGLLKTQMDELAATSDNPQFKQAAADLALAYARAFESMDEGLNRLREQGRDLASGIASDLAGVVVKFTSFKDLVASVGQRFQAMIVKQIEAPLAKALEGYFRRFIDQISTNAVSKEITPVLAGEYGELGYGAEAATATAEASKATAIAAATATQQSNTFVVGEATVKFFTLITAAEAAAQALLKVAAAGGGGGAGGLGSIASIFSANGGAGGIDYNFGGAGFPLAGGTDYVPHDNFRALLHKGEQVVPRAFNPAAGGFGGRAPNVTINAPPGSEVERVESSRDGMDVEVFMKATERRIAGNYARGRSPLNTATKARGIDQTRGLPKRG